MKTTPSFFILAMVFALAFSFNPASADTWEPPGANPPAGNRSQPIDVSANPQTKAGRLGVGSNTLTPSANLHIQGLNNIAIFESTNAGEISVNFKSSPVSWAVGNTSYWAKGFAIQQRTDYGNGFQGGGNPPSFLATTDGKIGINTTGSLTQTVEINKRSGTTRLRITDTATNPELQLQYGIQSNEHWSFYVDNATERLKIWKGGDLLTIDTAGNVGIGTVSPGYKLDVQGGQINASGGICISGDCKTTWAEVGSSLWTDQGAYYQPNNTALFNILDTGRIGIGTNNPDSILHLGASVSPTITIDNTDTTIVDAQVAGVIDFVSRDTNLTGNKSISQIKTVSTGSGGSARLSFFTRPSPSIDPQERLSIYNDGEVGIGISDPDRMLHVNNVTNPAIKISAGTTLNVELAVATSDNSFNNLASYGDVILRTFGNGADDLILHAQNNIFFTSYNNSTENLQLKVNEEAGISIGRNNMDIIDPENLIYGNISSVSTGNLLLLQKNTQDKLIVNNNGRLDAKGGLCINGDCKTTWSEVGFWTASGNNIYNSNSANVGIGVTSPQSKLDVNGNIIVSGTIKLGNFNNANKPTCNVPNKGAMYFDITNDKPYVCANNSIWKPLDSDGDKDSYINSPGTIINGPNTGATYDCNDNDYDIGIATDGSCDGDGDGHLDQVAGGDDCNDNNAAIFQGQIFYSDGDGDDFGYGQQQLLCSLTPPAGYATNNTDCLDSSNIVRPNQTDYFYGAVNNGDYNCNNIIEKQYFSYDFPYGDGNITKSDNCSYPDAASCANYHFMFTTGTLDQCGTTQPGYRCYWSDYYDYCTRDIYNSDLDVKISCR